MNYSGRAIVLVKIVNNHVQNTLLLVYDLPFRVFNVYESNPT